MTADPSGAICRFGSGPRRTVALHCTFARGKAWRGFGIQLADCLSIVAPDLPSHGEAPDWEGDGSYLAACADTVAPLLAEPVDLVGHSFGAVVALCMALEKDHQIRSLCLIEPVLFAAARREAVGVFTDFQTQTAGYTQAIAAGEYHIAAQEFTAIWGDGRAWWTMPEKTRDYITERMPLISAQKETLFEDSANLFAQGRLEALNMPVLLVRGGQSPGVINAIHQHLADRLPRAREAVVPDAGHMVPITHVVQVANLYADFLKNG